jgi:hypothetical protein
MTPKPDEDFIDPADEYKMPWEEDTHLSEGVRSKAGNASSYAASTIGLEISLLRTRALSCRNSGTSSRRS